MRYLKFLSALVIAGAAFSLAWWVLPPKAPVYAGSSAMGEKDFPAEDKHITGAEIEVRGGELANKPANEPANNPSQEPSGKARVPEIAHWPDAEEIDTVRLQVRVDSALTTPAEELHAGLLLLAKNDLAAAARHFSSLIAHNSHHLEARLGLAEVALRQEKPGEARAHYQAALLINPQDRGAMAGMAAIMAESGEIEAEALESLLRRLLFEEPELSSSHFVLGNFLAGQGRWQEAEEAYFAACHLEANNPDYRFNLAVSLDALGQVTPAAQYYRAALLAAEVLPHAFDKAVAEQRLAALEAGKP